MYQEIQRTYGIKEEQKRTPSAAAFERKSESTTPANYTYKAALENISTLNLFQQQCGNEPVMQRMVAKRNRKRKLVIYMSQKTIDKFHTYYKKINNPLKTKKSVTEHFEMVLKNALRSEGVTEDIIVNWNAVQNNDLTFIGERAQLSASNILYYNSNRILLPLLEDLVEHWTNTPYLSNSGCVGDSLGVIKGASNIKTSNANLQNTPGDVLNSPMPQNIISDKYNNVTFDGKKVEPYYTGGSDILYRLNGLKLVYCFNPDTPIQKRLKLTSRKISKYLETRPSIVSLGKPDSGHNVAVVNNTVYDMQTDRDWSNATNTNARVKPIKCQKKLADYNDYYVEYIYQ